MLDDSSLEIFNSSGLKAIDLTGSGSQISLSNSTTHEYVVHKENGRVAFNEQVDGGGQNKSCSSEGQSEVFAS